MMEREIAVTVDGSSMKTFVFHPDEGGPHPVVLYLMDAPGIRPALKDMASRLASAGYYVMLPFLYHRHSPYREFGQSDEDMHARQGLMRACTKADAVRDCAALIAAADADPAARAGPVGAVGFCMSGPFVLAAAQAMPARIAAGASLHGAWFFTDVLDGVPLAFDRIKAELYFGWADSDPTAPLRDLEEMRSALQRAHVVHRIEYFEGAQHGFAIPGPRHHRAAAETHWARVHALFQRRLKTP